MIEYRIDNIPWFARGLASGDVVEAKADTDGVLWIVRRLRWSGHMTIRVMCQRDEDALSARDSFKEFGADVEVAGHWGLLALEIPAGVDPHPIKVLLRAGEQDGRWGFEEGCITDEWRAL